MKTFLFCVSLVALLCFVGPVTVNAAETTDVFNLGPVLKGAALVQFDSLAEMSINNYRFFLEKTKGDSIDVAKSVVAFRRHIAEVRTSTDMARVTKLLLFMHGLAQFRNISLVCAQIDTLGALLQRQGAPLRAK